MMWGRALWRHWLGMIVYRAVLITIAIRAVGRLFPPAQGRPSTGRDALDARRARGEMDPAQYRRLRDLIER